MPTVAVSKAQSNNVWDFLKQHKRLPYLGDKQKPWTYQGWLLPYVIGIHEAGLAGDRWGYHLRTLAGGKLLDEPIPQVAFGEGDKKVPGMLEDWTNLVAGGWSDFRTLLEWLSWGLDLSSEAPRLDDKTNEKLYRAVNLGPLIQTPRDYLGDFITQRIGKGWNPCAFFPTPHQVVELMVQMTMHDERDCPDRRVLSVLDPCVGTGRMLMHAANYSMNLYGQDIDGLVCMACKINGALYVPWMAFPLPAAILGRAVPAPPPAPLPVPDPPVVAVYRIDDRGQGLLFDDEKSTPPRKRRKVIA